jgi:FkbM family methyltransferase
MLDGELQMQRLAKRLARSLAPGWAYRIYRQRKIAQKIATYPVHEVVHSFGGHSLRVHLADPLAEGWYDRDWDELAEVSFLLRRGVLRRGGRVFDLGAHQGVVALVLARTVGPSGSVVAVEGERHNAEVAAINCKLNAVETVEVVHAVVADTSGTRSFVAGLNGNVDENASFGNVEVPSVTIDELAARFGDPDLVFLDVEGYEGRALQGATETLRRRRASFFVEVHASLVGFRPSQLVSVFFGNGFTVYTSAVDPDGRCDLQPLHGDLPVGRFYLVAVPEERADVSTS